MASPVVLALVALGTVLGSAAFVVPRVQGAGLGWPPVPGDAQQVRLLPPVAVVSSGPYVVEHTLPGGVPATYDPCWPVHYVVNPAGMPAAAASMIGAAAAVVSAATGLVLVDDGPTDEPLRDDREILQRARYGNRWAPVLVGWSTAAAYPMLAGDVAGVGGSALVQPRGPASGRLVSGQIALDAEALAGLIGSGRSEQAQAIVLHEFGHVVGLDHVDDPAQLMYPRNRGRTAFGPGDLEGLARLGHGVCHDDT